MHTNVVKFPKFAKTRNAGPIEMLKDNVIQMKDWRERSRCRRTSQGVFFTSEVLCAPGFSA